MEKRILLNEDKDLLGQLVGDLSYFKPLLEVVKEKYILLEIGNFDSAAFESVRNNLSAVEKKFRSDIEKEIERTGIKRSFSQQAFRDQNEPLWQDLKEALKALIVAKPQVPYSSGFGRTQTLSLPFVSYSVERQFHISDENKEQLLEQYCRTYVETENEKIVYDALNEFGVSFKKLEGSLSKAGVLNEFQETIKQIRQELLTVSGDGYSPKAGAVSWVSAIERSKAYHQKRADEAREAAEKKRIAHDELMAKFDSGEIHNIADPHGHYQRMNQQEVEERANRVAEK